MVVATVLTVVSGWDYLRGAQPLLLGPGMSLGTEVDVVVVGGGATGAGVLRDLAMRGLRATLVEHGTSPPGRAVATTACSMPAHARA